MLFSGWDVSPNHAGAVFVDEMGTVQAVRFYVQPSKGAKRTMVAERYPGLCSVVTRFSGKKTREKSIDRIVSTLPIFQSWLTLRPSIVCIEDYAHSQIQGAHYVGEIGAIARLAIKQSGACLALAAPTTIKKFATGSGRASKEEMKAAAEKRYDFKKYGATAHEDLSDALFAALLSIEIWRDRCSWRNCVVV